MTSLFHLAQYTQSSAQKTILNIFFNSHWEKNDRAHVRMRTHTYTLLFLEIGSYTVSQAALELTK